MAVQDPKEARVDVSEERPGPENGEPCPHCGGHHAGAAAASTTPIKRRRFLVRTALAAGAGFIGRFLPPSSRLSLELGGREAAAQSPYYCYPCGTCPYCGFVYSYPAFCSTTCDPQNCYDSGYAFHLTCYQYQYNGCYGEWLLCGGVDCWNQSFGCLCNGQYSGQNCPIG